MHHGVIIADPGALMPTGVERTNRLRSTCYLRSPDEHFVVILVLALSTPASFVRKPGVSLARTFFQRMIRTFGIGRQVKKTAENVDKSQWKCEKQRVGKMTVFGRFWVHG